MKSNAYLLSRLPIKDVKKENLDSLSFHLWNHTNAWTFNPSNGVTNSIMNSSSINIISDNASTGGSFDLGIYKTTDGKNEVLEDLENHKFEIVYLTIGDFV